MCAGNLHTAELLRWELYSYLRNDMDNSFENIFDRGPFANCLQFWGARGAIDWGPVYQAQWQESALILDIALDCIMSFACQGLNSYRSGCLWILQIP